MIYSDLRFMPGGDRFIEVELGNEMSFDLNIRVHTLAAVIREARVDGIIELVPELASLLISYDPDRIGYADVVTEVGRLHGSTASGPDRDMDSRLFYVPLLYFDPWTQECIDDYRKSEPGKVPDPELLCQINGLSGRAELQRIHSGTEYWVAALGFWPGLCSLMPLDPRASLTAPKYNPPRSWTPRGSIGLGGGLTAVYPDRTPGGYQLFGRTPMPIWDRDQRLSAFKDSLALFRPGDRVRFVPIDRDEWDYVEAKVAEGSYQHPVVDYQTFPVSKYRAWLARIAQE